MTKQQWVYEGHDNHNNFDEYRCPVCGNTDKWATYVNPTKDNYACLGCGWRPDDKSAH